MEQIFLKSIDYKSAVKNIRRILQSHIEKSGLKCLVLGVSGGIDSTLCAALARPVCDKLNIPLIGRSITIETNKKEEINRAFLVGENFCTNFSELDLTSMYRIVRDTMIGAPPPEDVQMTHRVACGNLKARIRMLKLYSIAGMNKGMVLSTDNYTELLAGFWTLHGDVGDFGMIQNLWKTEVYAMSEYIVKSEYEFSAVKAKAINDCILATPTDGLGITNSDLDQLGVKSYDEADMILKAYLFNSDKGNLITAENHPLIKRYHATEFKRQNPFNIPREEVLKIA